MMCHISTKFAGTESGSSFRRVFLSLFLLTRFCNVYQTSCPFATAFSVSPVRPISRQNKNNRIPLPIGRMPIRIPLTFLQERDGAADSGTDRADTADLDNTNQRLKDGLDDLISQSVDEDIVREVRGEKQQTSAAGPQWEQQLQQQEKEDDAYTWDVYVCQSKPCKERGAGATLDAFVGLAPPQVKVHPAIISKARGKGPIVRCVKREVSSGSERELDAFEVSGVDGVDKVHRILTKHMSLDDVDSTACECLKWNYQGNAHLEKGEISEAIESYGRAISTQYADQEGVVLLMRSTAYLKRAFEHQKELRKVVEDLQDIVPKPESLQLLFETAKANPNLARALHQRVLSDCRKQDKQFRQIKFRHSLYEYALLHAAQDSLRATQLLPHYAKTWLRAGDSLAELRKLRESSRYYERAMELDPALVETLTSMPVVERLRRSQEFLDQARALGWPEDTLRLALDVAG